MKKLTTEQFIEKAKLIHGNKYDYSLVEYKSAHVKVKIICPNHGVFEEQPSHHLKGHGCKKCAGTEKLTTEQFIEKAKLIHGDKYDYSLVDYKNANTKVKIICPKHGVFKQSPNVHLSKGGCDCPFCSHRSFKLTTEEFIKKAKIAHGNNYDYSLTNYINGRTKVKIICPKHGVFEQLPNDHYKKGCPKCNSSKGEIKVRNFLKENGILFEEQKKFKDCKNEKPLPFDFYLPEKNLLIEYDGEQHYFPKEIFGGEKGFTERKVNDKIKDEYAKKNGIKLIRIPYYDFDKIGEILNENIR